MKFTFIPPVKTVCAKQIDIEINENTRTIEFVKFTGGCIGNQICISNLVTGMSIDDVIDKCQGIKCGNKETSCPDQLANALIKILNAIE